MRGLANVRAEFSLTALAYNLRRALNIVGVEAMIFGYRRGLRQLRSPVRAHYGRLKPSQVASGRQ